MILIRIFTYLLIMFTWHFSTVHAQEEWPLTDFSKTTIDMSEVLSGGPPKDGIPAIDKPEFLSFNQAKNWIGESEPVIALEHKGVAKAYPLQILIYHEIVNDVIANLKVAVTFCPLCNASIVFNRSVQGNLLSFGTTGRLRNSDLIMYDRQTESWWQQFEGEGIVGRYAGEILEQVPSQIISFKNYQTLYPNGKVLSRNTGFSRPYGNNPYPGYDDINNVPFLMKNTIDKRLPPMERVIGVTLDGKTKLYPFSKLEDKQILQDDSFNGIVIFSTGQVNSALDKRKIGHSKLTRTYAVYDASLDGKIINFRYENGKLLDRKTKSEWLVTGKAVSGQHKGRQLKKLNYGEHFAFAWLAFKPDAIIFR